MKQVIWIKLEVCGVALLVGLSDSLAGDDTAVTVNHFVQCSPKSSTESCFEAQQSFSVTMSCLSLIYIFLCIFSITITHIHRYGETSTPGLHRLNSELWDTHTMTGPTEVKWDLLSPADLTV